MSNSSYGITFNGKHSFRDFGLIITSKTIGFPDRTPVLLRPPYSNTPIDLSNLYGQTVFGDRDFKVEFLLRDASSYSKEALAAKLTLVVNWLEGSMGRQPLVDDVDPSYYYLSEPTKGQDWSELLTCGQLTVDFTCNPYRVALRQEGNDEWDPFDFNIDIAQPVGFTVNGPATISLINASNDMLQPEVSVTGQIVLTVGDVETTFAGGTYSPLNQAYPVTLAPGVNRMSVDGTGTITFVWHKEMI